MSGVTKDEFLYKDEIFFSFRLLSFFSKIFTKLLSCSSILSQFYCDRKTKSKGNILRKVFLRVCKELERSLKTCKLLFKQIL